MSDSLNAISLHEYTVYAIIITSKTSDAFVMCRFYFDLTPIKSGAWRPNIIGTLGFNGTS